ncbi:mechanosensitive ion channel family protein [Paraglaciecola arctica]|uniref:mechanosensitive ion channel family protein n=1 Tax=Paraglaciecola arctica TaxID=1128911 RepID=UPI001C079E95|nr:mechanosensitive ion channel family protein [Paraglaciecola arctica]MBU3004552.1 mechanosensitive ion channel family protein [Paraglaciecola arctica]
MQTQLVLDDLSQFTQLVVEKLPSIFLGVLIFAIFFWLSRPIANLLTKPLAKATTSKLIQMVVRRIMSMLVVLVGLYILLRLVGLTQFAVALLSGTGVLGLIIGFAFKDIAENFLSSLLLSVQRPFNLGDIIEVEGYLGVVKKMTSRATTLVDFNGDHVQLPNATIYKNAIRNLTANPYMRSTVDIGVGYDSNFDHAQSLAMDIMLSHPAILDDPAPQALVDSLGASTCNLRLYFWVNSEVNSPLKVSSVLMKRVVERFLAENIAMPDDARERIILNPETLATPSVSNIKSGQVNSEEKVNNVPNESANDDTSSDHDEIREQAAQARDPEEGDNIL